MCSVENVGSAGLNNINILDVIMDNCGTTLENFHSGIIAGDVDIFDVASDNCRTILKNTDNGREFLVACLFFQIRIDSLTNVDVLDRVCNFNFSVVENANDRVVATGLENLVMTEYSFGIYVGVGEDVDRAIGLDKTTDFSMMRRK
jgi:hypothetical protein